MATYLVTGGAGFIGSHLVDALLARGDSVRVLDNLSTGSKANLAHAEGRDLSFSRAILLRLDRVREAVAGVDYVLHQAALPSVPRSIADPLLTHNTCATGTLNVLIAARDAGVKRVVYAASSLGLRRYCRRVQSKRTWPRARCLPLCGYAKLTGEQYCGVFYHVYGLETVALRYFNVFGPRQGSDLGIFGGDPAVHDGDDR